VNQWPAASVLSSIVEVAQKHTSTRHQHDPYDEAETGRESPARLCSVPVILKPRRVDLEGRQHRTWISLLSSAQSSVSASIASTDAEANEMPPDDDYENLMFFNGFSISHWVHRTRHGNFDGLWSRIFATIHEMSCARGP